MKDASFEEESQDEHKTIPQAHAPLNPDGAYLHHLPLSCALHARKNGANLPRCKRSLGRTVYQHDGRQGDPDGLPRRFL